LLLILRRPIPVSALLGVPPFLLLGVNQVVVLPGVVFPKDCGGGTTAQAVHGLLHFPLGPERCDLLLPAVIHNPDLIDVCDLGAFSGVAGVPLHTAEYTPDAGDGGRLIPSTHSLPTP